MATEGKRCVRSAACSVTRWRRNPTRAPRVHVPGQRPERTLPMNYDRHPAHKQRSAWKKGRWDGDHDRVIQVDVARHLPRLGQT